MVGPASRSGCEPVSPRLSPILLEDAQSGHASRSQLALSRRGSGELRSVTPATTRACPVGGPGDARRLGEPEFRAPRVRCQTRPVRFRRRKANLEGFASQTRPLSGFVAAKLNPKPIRQPERRFTPRQAAFRALSFSLVFSHGFDEEPPRPRPTERWSIAERRSHRVVLSTWVFRAGRETGVSLPM